MLKISKVFYLIGTLIAVIIPFKFLRYFKILSDQFFSGWMRNSFKSCGINFRASSPIALIGAEFIQIGNNFSTFANLRLEAISLHNGNIYSPLIKIGDNVSINYDCHIGCVNEIVIGNGALLASRVFITDHFHGEVDFKNLNIPPSIRKVQSKGPVHIGDNVWIGEGVAIMPNVTIGSNSIIGANSVVTKSFPAYSIIAGVPAKLIKTLNQ